MKHLVFAITDREYRDYVAGASLEGAVRVTSPDHVMGCRPDNAQVHIVGGSDEWTQREEDMAAHLSAGIFRALRLARSNGFPVFHAWL